MRFAAAVAAAGLAAGVAAYGNDTAPVYVTEVVTAYTTYCPEATMITHAGQTYTVSEATTLTITNCPGGCTVTKPVTSSTPVAPVPYTTSPSAAPYPSTNGTSPISYYPSGTGAPSASASATHYTGDASKVGAAAGAGLLAVFGLVAAL